MILTDSLNKIFDGNETSPRVWGCVCGRVWVWVCVCVCVGVGGCGCGCVCDSERRLVIKIQNKRLNLLYLGSRDHKPYTTWRLATKSIK